MTGVDRSEHSPERVLVAWTVRARTPRVLGPGRRWRHILRPGESCQDKDEVVRTADGIVPRENETGQGIVPTGGEVGRWTPARRRLAELVSRARSYAKTIREGRYVTQQELAESEGVSQAYVSQVLSLLRIAAPILDVASDPDRDEPVPTLSDLLEIGRLPSPRQQVQGYRAIVSSLEGRRNGVKAAKVKVRGFQHLFAEARALQAALDSGAARSVTELAKARRVSHHRIGHILDLLTLPAEIQAALDVPVERLPKGITQKEVRKIAKLKDPAAQREAFASLSGAVAAK